MNKELLLELAKKEAEIFNKINLEDIQIVPFYGDMYHYTYGQSKAVINPISSIISSECLTNGKNILEVFAGVAFESAFLKLIYPKNNFYAIDIDDVLLTGQKFKKINYIKGDAVNGEIPGTYDFVFGGVTNSSQCEIPTVKDMISHMNTVSKCLIEGGIFIISIFYHSLGTVTGKISTHYEAIPVQFGKNSSQSWITHCYSLYTSDPYTARCRFHMLVVIEKKGKIIQSMYSDDYVPRDWAYDIVSELGEMNGYEFLKEHSSYEYGMLTFRKKGK